MNNEIKEEIILSEEVKTTEDENKAKKNAFVLREIIELRKENKKVFEMSDGTMQAEIYPVPVHFYNEEKLLFEEINNDIEDEEDGNCLRNKRNKFSVKFSKQTDTEELFTVENEGYVVKISSREHPRRKTKKKTPKLVTVNGTNNVVYPNIETDTDYRYTINTNNVKEDIVIKKRRAFYKYSFVVEHENLNIIEKDNGEISFESHGGKEMFFIPTPFMYDSNGEFNTNVSYKLEIIDAYKTIINVIADENWINAENRTFPVIIDPQLSITGSNLTTSYLWSNGNVSKNSAPTVGIATENGAVNRMYMEINSATNLGNYNIRKVELKLRQTDGFAVPGDVQRIGVFKVTKPVSVGVGNTNDFENIPIDYARLENGGRYLQFDITKVFDDFYNSNGNNASAISKPTLLFKMLDETIACPHYAEMSCYNSSTSGPIINVTYTTKFSMPDRGHCETHEIGSSGMGYVDLLSGDLFLDLEDFTWQGQRMPVNIKHYYNNSLKNKYYTKNAVTGLKAADFSAMKLGYGWHINYMQSMVACTFNHNNESVIGYVYVDGEGNETYFKPDDSDELCCMYKDIDDVGYTYNEDTKTLTMGGEKYVFDTKGRLIKITNGNALETRLSITYTNNRITAIRDGVNRTFTFTYNSSNELTSIAAPDGVCVSYAYTNGYLSKIIYPNGQKINISSGNNGINDIKVQDSSDKFVYKIAYNYINKYATDHSCISSITDYVSNNGTDNWINPKTTRLCSASSSNKAYVEYADNEGVEKAVVYSFDEDGSLVGNYEIVDGRNTPLGSGGENEDGSSEILLKKPSINLLSNHGFEKFTNNNFNSWSRMSGNGSNFTLSQNTSTCKFGRSSAYMETRSAYVNANGIYQQVNNLGRGNYTFSAYVYCNTVNNDVTGIYLRITDTNNSVIAKSELVRCCNDGFVRIVLPFKLDVETSVRCQILADGYVNVYIDGAQLENNDYATPYNLLENGNAESSGSAWTFSSGASRNSTEKFDMSTSFKISGSLDSRRYVSQAVKALNGQKNCESFTLSGWAKAPCFAKKARTGEQTPIFRLRAVINYTDSTTETHCAEFSAYTEEWQMASVDFAKRSAKVINNITVYCEYGYALGEAFFDSVQLVRNDLDAVAAFLTETEDNSDSAGDTTTSNEFKEATDSYGNAITETNYADDGIGTFYRSFEYQNSGNDLYRETDERGYKTFHIVDAETSLDTEVIDRCGNRTYYEYDAAKNVTKTRSANSSGVELANVSYAYNSHNNLKEITRGDGMKYSLAYNDFNNLESIGIVGKNEKLISYTYKNGRGKLKEVTYANGHTMEATYNSVGQIISEKWYSSEQKDTLVAKYHYTYDSDGNIVRSIDFSGCKEYNYVYDEGKIVRATECNITHSNDIVTSKSLVFAITYYYDVNGKLYKKLITPTSGYSYIYTYGTGENNSTSSTFEYGDHLVTANSTADSLGRKTSDFLVIGTRSMSREFSYHLGAVTAEHTANNKIKSSPTTRLVKKISLSDGRTLSYEYDGEERITKVIDSLLGTTEYTYDALGQLLTEKLDCTEVNTMTYDNYGNIKSKNGVAYTYDSVWKDLLTGVGNSTISYDAQGNPTSYLGHTLTWEKGRQLKSFDTNTYTYNADGIRTSKTVNGIKHTYTLEGTNIVKEEWNGNTLVPLYDDEESVCGILYNNAAYYFRKNLQGDIIAITNSNAVNVAIYTYDAWGKCTIVSDTSGCNIATVNPFRYRGYYFDTETELYYLQSRYYDSSIGRFINSDEAIMMSIEYFSLCHNLFAYCCNNFNYSDYCGYFRIATWIVSTALDLIFALLNHLMMCGYLALSSTIWTLARTPFTRKLALNIFKTKVVAIYIRGFYNSALTGLSKFLRTLGVIGVEFAKSFSQSKALDLLSRAINSRFMELIISILTWGGIISLFFDMADGVWDGYITI